MGIFGRQRKAIQAEIARLKEQGVPTTFEELNVWYPALSGPNGAAAYRAAFASLLRGDEEPEPDLSDFRLKMPLRLRMFFLRLAVSSFCSGVYRDVSHLLLPHWVEFWFARRRLEKWNRQADSTPERADIERKPELPIIGFGSPMPPEGPLSAETREGLEKYLAGISQGLGLLREALKNSQCRFEPDWSCGLNDVMDCRTGVHRAVRALGVQALLAGDAGESALATQALCDAFAVIATLRSIPNYSSLLGEICCGKTMLSVLEWLLNRTRFTDADLATLSASLNRFEDPDVLRRTHIGERCFGMCFTEPTPPIGMRFMRGNLMDNVSAWFMRIPDHLEYLNQMQSSIDCATLPQADQWDKHSEIIGQIARMPNYLRNCQVLHSADPDYFYSAARFRVQLGVARTALAVERFRIRTGWPPEDLEDLVPAFLTKIPRDITGKGAVRYERNGIGFTVGSEGIPQSRLQMNSILSEEVRFAVVA